MQLPPVHVAFACFLVPVPSKVLQDAATVWCGKDEGLISGVQPFWGTWEGACGVQARFACQGTRDMRVSDNGLCRYLNAGFAARSFNC